MCSCPNCNSADCTNAQSPIGESPFVPGAKLVRKNDESVTITIPPTTLRVSYELIYAVIKLVSG